MEIYIKPMIDIEKFESEDVITTSVLTLTNGGANGKSEKDSFKTMFG